MLLSTWILPKVQGHSSVGFGNVIISSLIFFVPVKQFISMDFGTWLSWKKKKTNAKNKKNRAWHRITFKYTLSLKMSRLAIIVVSLIKLDEIAGYVR